MIPKWGTKLALYALTLGPVLVAFSLLFSLHLLPGSDTASHLSSSSPQSYSDHSSILQENLPRDGRRSPLEDGAVSTSRRSTTVAPPPNADPVPQPVGQAHPPASSKLKYHLIVSTGCSAFQDWQSYIFFYQVWKSGQEGEVTRVASGCKTPQDEETLRQSFREQIASMSPNFKLHITPDYSKIVPGLNFKYFNKCFGVQHWMKNALKMPGNPVYNDTIFVLLDPDQLVVRRFDDDYENEEWLKDRGVRAVEHGKPIAQSYGIGTFFWTKMNTSHILGTDDPQKRPSPLWNTTQSDLKDYYISGPPYMLTGFDMMRLVDTWAEFNPPVKELTPTKDILSEMKAYILASRHLDLPHQIGKSYMVSVANDYKNEGWKSVDEIEEVCVPYDKIPTRYLPHTLHYCQGYHSGLWFFGKYALPTEVLSCEHPLLEEPNVDIARNKYLSAITPQGQRKDMSPVQARHHAFMLCQIIPRVNKALEYFKQQHCSSSIANFSKSFALRPPPKKVPPIHTKHVFRKRYDDPS